MLGFLVMLKQNVTLEYLELHIDTELFDMYAPSIMSYHDRLLPPSPESPIPLECQAAFLELFRDSKGRSLRFPRLESNAIARIFAFAAAQPTRLVCLVEY